MARIHFSDHSVERFIERHAPGMTWEEARAHLENEGERAVRLRERTILGQEQWELQDPKCILVIKNSDDAGRVCKTILPNKDTFGGMSEDELELIREASERMPPLLPSEVTHQPKTRPPPKPAKRPPPIKKIAACLPKAQAPQEAVELHRLLMERARQKDEEKTRRHFARQEEQVSKQKNVIRIALRYLLGKAADADPVALAICEEIQEVEPGFVTEAFLAPKKKTG